MSFGDRRVDRWTVGGARVGGDGRGGGAVLGLVERGSGTRGVGRRSGSVSGERLRDGAHGHGASGGGDGQSGVVAVVGSDEFMGQNTTAIAANEFDYIEMWAQDVAAMVGYHSGATSVASTLTPFDGLGIQLAGMASPVSTVVQRVEAAVPAAMSTLKALPWQEVSMLMYPASMAMSPLMMTLSTAARGSTAGVAGTAAAGIPASIPKLAGGALSGVKALGAGRLGSAMSAGLGKARLVGAMLVPSTWQGSMPAGMASSAMRGLGAMPHSAADLHTAGASAGRTTPMPMPMGGAGGEGMAGGMMGRGGASPQTVQKRPCVVPRAGV